jgi:hypothetical protein
MDCAESCFPLQFTPPESTTPIARSRWSSASDFEKDVDWGPLVIGSPGAAQPEPALADGQGRAGWQNMNLL